MPKHLTQRIKELSERQAKAILIDLSMTYRDAVSISVHYAEKEGVKKGVLYY